MVEKSAVACPVQVKPFVPLTGNPENGNYADYMQYLEDRGEVQKLSGGALVHGSVFVADKPQKISDE